MGRIPYLLLTMTAVGLYLLLSLAALPILADHSPVCGSCHAVRRAYQTAYGSSHAEIGCLACHRSPGVGGAVSSDFRAVTNLWSWVVRPPSRNERVDNDACLKCHDVVLEGVQTIGKIKVRHREIIEAGARCGDCHGEVGHELPKLKADIQQSSMDKCFGCHAQNETMSVCSTCHIGKVGGKPVKRTTMGAAAHDRGWRGARHGASRAEMCPVCHEREYCRKCHGIELPHTPDAWPREHGSAAKAAGLDTCSRCHKEDFCDSCHAMPMPHPKAYVINHRDLKAPFSTCLFCHAKSECLACHDTHNKHKKRIGGDNGRS